MSYIKLLEKTINDLNSPADINQLMDNIEALKGGVESEAPVSNIASLSTAITAIGDGIIESGSNSNGRYIKFRNGTMICWGSKGATTAGVSVNWSYPATFISDAVAGIVFSITDIPSATWTHCNVGYGSSVGYWTYAYYSGNGFQWLAIGRWK